MKKVLIVRLTSMGDLIHTWPAVTDLKSHYPDVELTWLVDEVFSEIPLMHPGIGKIIPVGLRRFRQQIHLPSAWKRMYSVCQQLRETEWDRVVDCQGLLKSALFGKWTGRPLMGYDRHSIREPSASFLYDKNFEVKWLAPVIYRSRTLFSKVFGYQTEGLPVFGVTPSAKPDWLDADKYAVMLHSTSKTAKEWPESHWIELGQILTREYGVKLVFPWGNKVELERSQRLAQSLPDAMVAPRMSLREASGMLGHAKGVIGMDTGLMHMTNAFDVPLVGVYTHTDPALCGVTDTGSGCARNVGGKNQLPSVDDVLQTLLQCKGWG